MQTSQKLKDTLIKIKKDNYNICEKLDIDKLIVDMLEYIGSVDFELRDNLIYSTFYSFTQKNILTVNQMKNILKVCLDEEHLFFNIGEKNTDSVFTRSFSVLTIPLALLMNSNSGFLEKTDIIHIKGKVADYIKKEKDFRGFVVGKGWAHSVAHAADALKYLAENEFILHDDLKEILGIIKFMISNEKLVYNYGEDTRTAKVFLSVLKRKLLSDKEIIDWLYSLNFPHFSETVTYPDIIHLKENQKGFLQSVYFYLLKKNEKMIVNKIFEILEVKYT